MHVHCSSSTIHSLRSLSCRLRLDFLKSANFLGGHDTTQLPSVSWGNKWLLPASLQGLQHYYTGSCFSCSQRPFHAFKISTTWVTIIHFQVQTPAWGVAFLSLDPGLFSEPKEIPEGLTAMLLISLIITYHKSLTPILYHTNGHIESFFKSEHYRLGQHHMHAGQHSHLPSSHRTAHWTQQLF